MEKLLTPTPRDRHMDYHKTTIALIAWLVWGGDKKTADEIGRDEYFSVIGSIKVGANVIFYF